MGRISHTSMGLEPHICSQLLFMFFESTQNNLGVVGNVVLYNSVTNLSAQGLVDDVVQDSDFCLLTAAATGAGKRSTL